LKASLRGIACGDPFGGVSISYFEEYLLDKGLDKLIGPNDRKLVIEALCYKCDVFCTRDLKTILSQRTYLSKIFPLQILTPSNGANGNTTEYRVITPKSFSGPEY